MSDDRQPDYVDPATGEVLSPVPLSVQASVIGEKQLEQGTLERRAFTPKDLLPDNLWISQNVQNKPVGFEVIIGRVFGEATRHERINTPYQQKTIPGVALNGLFSFESAVTGINGTATTVYLPMQYAEKVAQAFENPSRPSKVLVDCDIGLRVTRRPLPVNFEWIVYAFREGAEVAKLAALRNSRRSRGSSPMLPPPTGPAPAALAAPEDEVEAIEAAAGEGQEDDEMAALEVAARGGRVLEGEVLPPLAPK
jgi:hypothetical protein